MGFGAISGRWGGVLLTFQFFSLFAFYFFFNSLFKLSLAIRGNAFNFILVPSGNIRALKAKKVKKNFLAKLI